MHSHCPFSVHLCPLVTMCRVFMSTCHAATNAHNATQRHSSPSLLPQHTGPMHRLARQTTHSAEPSHSHPTHGHISACLCARTWERLSLRKSMLKPSSPPASAAASTGAAACPAQSGSRAGIASDSHGSAFSCRIRRPPPAASCRSC